jgi:hypothetical protein
VVVSVRKGRAAEITANRTKPRLHESDGAMLSKHA